MVIFARAVVGADLAPNFTLLGDYGTQIYLCVFAPKWSIIEPLRHKESNQKSTGFRVVSVGRFQARSFSFHCGTVSLMKRFASVMRSRNSGWIS